MLVKKRGKKSTVAILTNFMEFNPSYSLTGICQDQCKMLQDNGHPVKLFVNSQYSMSINDEFQFNHNIFPENDEKLNLPVELYRTIPFSHLIDYTSINDLTDDHKKIIKQTKEMLLEHLKDVKYVFTHDFMLTGWFLPYGLGVIEAAKELSNTYFYHWVHSVPSSNRDWWDFNSWGGNHKIIFPNETEKVRVAEQYKTLPSNVECIHHIKDLRTWCDFCEDSNDFLRDHPAMLSADIIKVYPVSSDRFDAKGLDVVIKIFAHFKGMGYKVCLVVANQWATGKEREKDVDRYIRIAKRCGLETNKEFIFTSLWKDGKHNTGIPKRMLRDLMECSNLFIFPTREESFGLVCLEAALSTASVVVTNRSLETLRELHGGFTNGYHFGSYHQDVNCANLDQYYKDLALLIHTSLQRNSVVLHRTFIRQKYNWDYLYLNEYLPLFLSS